MSVSLHCGDCLDVMGGIDAGSVDLILADLPYGTTACKWDTVIPFAPLWEHYRRVLKPRGAVVLTASQPFTSALVMSNPGWFRHEWIWEKERPTNPLACTRQPPKYHESVVVFGQSPETFNPTRVARLVGNKRRNRPRPHCDATKGGRGKYAEMVTSGEGDSIYQPSVLRIPMQRGLHPTQKPVALMEYLIRTYTNEGELVLDNSMGSGTTGVACLNTGRRFIGIEKDTGIFAIAERRIQAVQRERSELLIA